MNMRVLTPGVQNPAFANNIQNSTNLHAKQTSAQQNYGFNSGSAKNPPPLQKQNFLQKKLIHQYTTHQQELGLTKNQKMLAELAGAGGVITDKQIEAADQEALEQAIQASLEQVNADALKQDDQNVALNTAIKLSLLEQENTKKLPIPRSIEKVDSHNESVLAFLDSLKEEGANLEGAHITPWDNLDADMQAVYNNNEHEYLTEVTQANTKNHGSTEELLKNHGMNVVRNNGEAGSTKNNCFLISVMQHAFTQFNSAHVNQYRDILSDSNLAKKNEQITSQSGAAKGFIDLLNQDLPQKLDVHVISFNGDKPYVDRLGDPSPHSRKILIWDQGGHFEAITAKNDFQSMNESYK